MTRCSTFGPIITGFFFEGAPDLMKDWHEPTVFLWLWHLSEEYEHRHVCNYAFKELYGSYWYRIYGLWFASFHLFSYVLRCAAELIRQDRASGRIPDRMRSRVRYAKVLLRIFRYMVPPVVKVCHRRSYDPGKLPPPRHSLELLDDVSQRYGILEPA
ncbi:MAG: metal-dependent hydrolase [Acidimicrobiia bacterium]